MTTVRFPRLPALILPLASALAVTLPALGESELSAVGGDTRAIRPDPDPGLWEGVPAAVKERGKWAFELGVGVIADTTPGSYLTLDYERYRGPGEGYTYNFTVSREIREFDWRLAGCRFQPVLEVPLMVTIVDQSHDNPVPDVNLGLMFRWRDFPWNRYVYTTFGVCGGLSYAFDDWRADVERHGGDDRSNLKFWLNLELTFAAPSHPEHQLTLFIDHQSGGHIFDAGGIDAWGVGYRHLF